MYRIYAVDARDGVAQPVTEAYDAADNVRFFKIEAQSAIEAVHIARGKREQNRRPMGVVTAPWYRR